MVSIIGGLVAIAFGILALITWSWRVVELIQGLIPIVLVIGGIVALVAGMGIVKEETAKAKVKSEN